MKVELNNYNDMASLAKILHGKCHISRGLQIQKSVYDVINNSGIHNKVEHEFVIQLPKGKQRKNTHSIDIVIIDKNSVRAYDSKGKSFNATQDPKNVLDEYNKYVDILKDMFPNKQVTYGVLKEDWNSSSKPPSDRYSYFEENGIEVLDTYKFILDNYGVNRNELTEHVETNIYNTVKNIIKENK
tara:strand:- start:140 stop:694 length:555 start_codon:yes stop_codon:yes gene_type:complete